MSTAVMMERIAEASPRFKARIAGVFWLMTALTGTLALVLRLGIATNLIASACYVAATLLVYELLKPVNRSLSLLAAFFSLLGCAIGALGGLFHLGLGGVHFVFFGLHCLLIGYLILRSTFLPRILGTMMASSGLGWLTFSFSNLLLSPPLARYLSPYVMGLGILGEVMLTVWLLVVGVNKQRWKEQASLAGR